MTDLTILSSMAGPDFEQALDRHVEWGLRHLDLKDRVFEKRVIDLTLAEAGQARDLIDARDLSVTCLSTNLFDAMVEKGEQVFHDDHLGQVDHAIEVARILEPTFVRLIAPRTERRDDVEDGVAYVIDAHPWLIPMLQNAVDHVDAGGFKPTIENEVNGCILSTPAEVRALFREIARPSLVFTWDIQNLWQMGTTPTLDVYTELEDLIGYVHLKGGRAEDEGGPLIWSTALEDASWPVLDIVRRVVADEVSPVICLNPSHGRKFPGYDYESVVERDLAYLRTHIADVAR